jgi:hypothetical protein
MKKTKLLLAFFVFIFLLSACGRYKQEAKTEYFFTPGQSVVFEYVCDYDNGLGAWFLVRTYNAAGESGMAVALSFQMSHEDYLDKCQPG